ncbi:MULTISPECIES: hypothetical protein [Clostridium]|uniref:Uncharacterized protein n=1 Tax=Clostridium cadaveris TaxID=1529 RepID=A0A1I2L4S9_9CLOT|nr:hypothetical protein [Clostridium cadaveris]MDU4951626.1 hypothetical protein [Clostridium sp.]MDM8311599.1 hypothetical protein [Clostridium cadaveris]MDY4950061.1 hypothetical protein [Clostridium cadaveris]NME63540.1 hypothetical protein [Clostridium cadaveris]NWK09813.1 hypothetical protein [Clostridium cadaveris]
MNEELLRLLEKYKETQKCLEMGITLVDQKDYAQGKLEIVNMMIHDIEKVLAE